MDFLKNAASQFENNNQNQQSGSGEGLMGMVGNKIGAMSGSQGNNNSNNDQDMLDKGKMISSVLHCKLSFADI
jgi:hypothetical protein